MALVIGQGRPADARNLIYDEPAGFAIDATMEGGSVYVKDTTTPKNNLRTLLNNSNLVQSGTSPKMVQWDSAPFVRWTPHNLAVYSEDFSNGDVWGGDVIITTNAAIAPNGTMTADKLASTGDGYWGQVVPAVLGLTYTFSVWLRSDSPLTTELYGSSVVTPVNVTTSWQRFSHIFVSDWSSTSIQIGGDGTFTLGEYVYAWGAQLNRGPIATPYLATTSAARIGIPQGYDVAVSKFGVLIEPAATNLAIYSQDVTDDNWATGYGGNLSSNVTTAPDGTTTADKIYPSAYNDYQSIMNTLSAAPGANTFTVSVYVKAAGYSWFELIAGNSDGSIAFGQTFDLTNGIVGTSTIDNGTATYITADIMPIGDSWYRCSITGSFAGASDFYKMQLRSASSEAEFGGDGQYTGDGSSGAYIWGLQAETGSVATSYIPTLGATVTRGADNIDILVNTYPHSTTGTMIVWNKPRIIDNAASNRLFEMNDLGDSNVIRVQVYSTDTPDNYTFVTGGVSSGTVKAGPLSLSGNRVAVAWATNDIALVVDGGTPSTTSSATPSTVTHLHFGWSNNYTPREWNGHIYQLTFLPRRMNNTDLQAVTT